MREVVSVFKALADGNRLRILKMLEVRPLAVCEITEILQLAPSTVSRHLAVLREAELILDEKEGKWVNYILNTRQENPYVRHLLPLVRTWLPRDPVVLADQERAQRVCRSELCGG